MSKISEIVTNVCSGVVRIAVFKNHIQVGGGSGFLSNGLLVTNSHVIRPPGSFDAVEITFGDQSLNPITPIRLLPEHLYSVIEAESPESEMDYAVLRIDEPELQDRFQFTVVPSEGVEVGEQVIFFGFPFQMEHLTSHVGYVSARFISGSTNKLQIDGSINPGNSGGPLLQVSSQKAVAIVTRTQTGLERDFDELLRAIQENIRVLETQRRARLRIAGIDPIQSTRVTMTILGRLANNLKRTANVGIGYAFGAEHILETGMLT